MSVNYERTFLLLSVVEKALGHPQLRPIVDLAQLELAVVTKDAAQAVKDLRAEEAKAEAQKVEEVKAKQEEETGSDEEPKPDTSKDKFAVGRRL